MTKSKVIPKEVIYFGSAVENEGFGYAIHSYSSFDELIGVDDTLHKLIADTKKAMDDIETHILHEYGVDLQQLAFMEAEDDN